MDPADQRFITDGLVVRQARLRLIIEFEFLLCQCLPQIARQAAALARLEIHSGLEEACLAARGFLGAIHCEIGVGQKLRPGQAIVRKDGDADARPDEQFIVIDREGQAHRAENALGERHDMHGVVGRRKDGSEFIAAKARRIFRGLQATLEPL